MNEQPLWKQKLPLTISSILLAMAFYFGVRIWVKLGSIIAAQMYGTDYVWGGGIFGTTLTVNFFAMIFTSCLAAFAWLFSTRIKIFQNKILRVLSFALAILSVWGNLAAYGMSQVKQHIIPYFENRLAHVIETDGFFESIVFKQTDGFYLMLVLIPCIGMVFISLFIMNKYIQFEDELKEAFFAFEWRGKWLQRISTLEKDELWPDIELGPNSETGEMVVLPGRDRTLNSMIIGSIGTGKTAALALPMIKQDLDHMVNFINAFPGIYQREDYLTEKVGGRYLNGISIIEPSNDLCQQALQLVKAHGIPDEAITYINPLDPNTPAINAMRGPVDKVAEVFAQVIAGLDDSKTGGSFYFEQAQRNHLKQHIYLLKLHEPNKEVTLDMLLDMYNNPQLVHKMHVALKKTIPSNIDLFEDRDERNYWKIVQGIDEWFDLNLIPKVDKRGMQERDSNGEILYFDAKEQHVQGLRNILNDIGANPLIRRVLFGTSDFDFDRHMAVGGVLLVNTAKGELVNLARVLGKIVLMNLQNASFRRPPKISPFHHIVVDEAPDYYYMAFREFPAQSRKYKVIITTLKQTIAQLADQFGEHYMTTLIGTMRNRMVYGDVPGFDAKYFSEMFGEKFTYQEGQSEMSVSPLQEDPVSRSGSSYSKVREQAMTGGDIMFQDAFQCAVKIVSNNKPMPVVQIKANFVPDEEYEKASYQVDSECSDVWLEQRRLYMNNGAVSAADAEEETISSIEETEMRYASLYEEERNVAVALKADSIIIGCPQPRDPVKYTPFVPATPIKREVQEINPDVIQIIRDEVAATVPPKENTKQHEPDKGVSLTHKREGYEPSAIPDSVEEYANNLKVESLFEDVD